MVGEVAQLKGHRVELIERKGPKKGLRIAATPELSVTMAVMMLSGWSEMPESMGSEEEVVCEGSVTESVGRTKGEGAKSNSGRLDCCCPSYIVDFRVG